MSRTTSVLASHPVLVGISAVVVVAGLAVGGIAVAHSGSTAAPSTAVAASTRQPSFSTVEKAVCAAVGPTDSAGDRCAILSMKVSTRHPQWVLAQGVGYYAASGPATVQNSRSDLTQVIFNLQTHALIGPTNVGFCNSANPVDLSSVPTNVLAGWGLSGCGAESTTTVIATTTTTTTPTTTTTKAKTPPTSALSAGFARFAGNWGAHEQSLVIGNSGAGHLAYQDLTACPSCSFASAPTSTMDFVLKSSNTDAASGTVVASSDPKNYTIGESVMLTLVPGSPGQILDVDIGGHQSPFCNSTSAGQCGA